MPHNKINQIVSFPFDDPRFFSSLLRIAHVPEQFHCALITVFHVLKTEGFTITDAFTAVDDGFVHLATPEWHYGHGYGGERRIEAVYRTPDTFLVLQTERHIGESLVSINCTCLDGLQEAVEIRASVDFQYRSLAACRDHPFVQWIYGSYCGSNFRDTVPELPIPQVTRLSPVPNSLYLISGDPDYYDTKTYVDLRAAGATWEKLRHGWVFEGEPTPALKAALDYHYSLRIAPTEPLEGEAKRAAIKAYRERKIERLEARLNKKYQRYTSVAHGIERHEQSSAFQTMQPVQQNHHSTNAHWGAVNRHQQAMRSANQIGHEIDTLNRQLNNLYDDTSIRVKGDAARRKETHRIAFLDGLCVGDRVTKFAGTKAGIVTKINTKTVRVRWESGTEITEDIALLHRVIETKH